MSQNSLGNGILEKQGVSWRSTQRTYLIIRFVGNSLRLLRFLFVCLAIKKKNYFVGLTLFCFGRKASFKAWPLWVGPYTTFAEGSHAWACVWLVACSLNCEALGLCSCETGSIHSRHLG